MREEIWTSAWTLGGNLKRWNGWRFSVLAGNEAFESAFGMRPASREALWNGAIACELIHYPARIPMQVSGVQQSEISRIERGQANPTFRTLQQIAHALKKTIGFVDAPRRFPCETSAE